MLHQYASKQSSGLLGAGIVCVNKDGNAVLVKELTTIKELDSKASYKEARTEDGGYLLPDADFDLTSEHTAKLDKYALTQFKTMKELNDSLIDIKHGIGIEDIVRVEDDEKSNALVSTSNQDFLKNLERDIDVRRNAALVLENSLHRVTNVLNRELDIKRRELQAQLDKQREQLMALHEEAMRAIAIFKKQLKKIQRLIATLEIYLGIHENVFQISEGEFASGLNRYRKSHYKMNKHEKTISMENGSELNFNINEDNSAKGLTTDLLDLRFSGAGYPNDFIMPKNDEDAVD